MIEEIYEGLEINQSELAKVGRIYCELAIFEVRLVKYNCKYADVLERFRHLKSAQNIPGLEKHFQNAWAILARHLKEQCKMVKYINPTNETDIFFSATIMECHIPIKAFGAESRRRIYNYLSKPILQRAQLMEAHRHELTYPDKVIKPLVKLHEDLANACGIRSSEASEARTLQLRTQYAEMNTRRESLKSQLASAGETEDTTRIESQLNRLQEAIGKNISEMQKLRESIKLPQ